MSIHLSAFGPGKVILLGEHSVVYGQPALAAPIRQGVRAYAEPAAQTSLAIPDGLSVAQQQVLERAFARAALKTRHPQVAVHVETDLPLSMGLGSSAALSVAVSRVLLEARTAQPARVEAVEALAFQMEQEFHGSPSGVDHTTSARGTMVLFEKKRARSIEAPKPVKVVVALVGPRKSTRVTVQSLQVRQKRWPARYRKWFASMGQLVREGVRAVRAGDLETLGDVMNMNQGALSGLGLSSSAIEDMVFRLRDMGALGAKLTGAGGDGGAVIGLFREPEPAVARLQHQGVTCFASQLAGPRTL